MKRKFLVVVGACLVAACARRHTEPLGVWRTRVPLGPAIRFTEAISPRTIAVLVLDAHTSAPIYYGAVSVPSERIGGTTDSAGVLRLRLPRSGQYALRVRGIGYESWQGNVSVSDTSGLALILQLRRSYAPLVPVVAGTEPPPGLLHER